MISEAALIQFAKEHGILKEPEVPLLSTWLAERRYFFPKLDHEVARHQAALDEFAGAVLKRYRDMIERGCCGGCTIHADILRSDLAKARKAGLTRVGA